MILENPIDPRVQAEIDRTHKALRVALRPMEYRSQSLVGGHFRMGIPTGSTTLLNTGDCLLSLRSTASVFRVLIHAIEVFASIRTAFTTAQELSVDLVRVTNHVAADAGGTAVTNGLTGTKAPGLGMSPAALGLRVASATAVTAGAGSVEEANALSAVAFPGLTNTLGLSGAAVLYKADPGEHPLILDSNQGLRARIGLTQGAAGVVVYRFNVDWSEVPVETFP